MPPTLEDEIRELRARFWSDRDPEGRAFAPLAERYRRAGDLDEAAALVEEGVERLPDFPPGHLVAARVRRDLGERVGALEAYARVLELDPGNAEALREGGELADAGGDQALALRHFQRLLRLHPDDEALRARVRDLKARYYGIAAAESRSEAEGEEPYAERRTAEAGTDLAAGDSGAEPAPVDGAESQEEPEVYTRTMAELYLRQGLEERAVEVYRRLVEASPEDEGLRARLRELDRAPEGPTAASYFRRMLAWPGAGPRRERSAHGDASGAGHPGREGGEE